MRIFIDTSAFYALLDRNDKNHREGKKAWTDILEAGHTLMTNNYTLVETFALLQGHLGLDAVRGFQEDVVPVLQVEFVTSKLHRSGIAALVSASRQRLSLVDCVSFAVMRYSGIKSVFTFDSHFKEQGFSVIP